MLQYGYQKFLLTDSLQKEVALNFNIEKYWHTQDDFSLMSVLGPQKWCNSTLHTSLPLTPATLAMSSGVGSEVYLHVAQASGREWRQSDLAGQFGYCIEPKGRTVKNTCRRPVPVIWSIEALLFVSVRIKALLVRSGLQTVFPLTLTKT